MFFAAIKNRIVTKCGVCENLTIFVEAIFQIDIE